MTYSDIETLSAELNSLLQIGLSSRIVVNIDDLNLGFGVPCDSYSISD